MPSYGIACRASRAPSSIRLSASPDLSDRSDIFGRLRTKSLMKRHDAHPLPNISEDWVSTVRYCTSRSSYCKIRRRHPCTRSHGAVIRAKIGCVASRKAVVGRFLVDRQEWVGFCQSPFLHDIFQIEYRYCSAKQCNDG